jgi:hypothetical protein
MGKNCPALTNRQSAKGKVGLSSRHQTCGAVRDLSPSMKISGSKSATPAGAARGAKGASGGSGFSLDLGGGVSETGGAARAAGVGALSSMGALLALQSVEDPLQRRRRAVSRAGRILDALDELKLTLLDGAATPARLQSLMAAVREERVNDDDPRLQGLLNEIETRAAVELAKLGAARPV